jgi:hypothetical protein
MKEAIFTLGTLLFVFVFSKLFFWCGIVWSKKPYLEAEYFSHCAWALSRVVSGMWTANFFNGSQIYNEHSWAAYQSHLLHPLHSSIPQYILTLELVLLYSNLAFQYSQVHLNDGWKAFLHAVWHTGHWLDFTRQKLLWQRRHTFSFALQNWKWLSVCDETEKMQTVLLSA